MGVSCAASQAISVFQLGHISRGQCLVRFVLSGEGLHPMVAVPMSSGFLTALISLQLASVNVIGTCFGTVRA